MNKKILIIDDEMDVLKILTYRLRAKGYEVANALNGSEGIQKAMENTPDLILLDYRLPDLRAKDIALAIRDAIPEREIPIILITASVDQIGDKAVEIKANDYIAKPIEPEELLSKVAKLIE